MYCCAWGSQGGIICRPLPHSTVATGPNRAACLLLRQPGQAAGRQQRVPHWGAWHRLSQALPARWLVQQQQQPLLPPCRHRCQAQGCLQEGQWPLPQGPWRPRVSGRCRWEQRRLQAAKGGSQSERHSSLHRQHVPHCMLACGHDAAVVPGGAHPAGQPQTPQERQDINAHLSRCAPRGQSQTSPAPHCGCRAAQSSCRQAGRQTGRGQLEGLQVQLLGQGRAGQQRDQEAITAASERRERRRCAALCCAMLRCWALTSCPGRGGGRR